MKMEMFVSFKEMLLTRTGQRNATVGIMGLGYVGLPLAVEFAEAGFDVIGLDVDATKVDRLNRGDSYIPDIPSQRTRPLVESGKLCATTHYQDLRHADAISICVPTPYAKPKTLTCPSSSRPSTP